METSVKKKRVKNVTNLSFSKQRTLDKYFTKSANPQVQDTLTIAQEKRYCSLKPELSLDIKQKVNENVPFSSKNVNPEFFYSPGKSPNSKPPLLEDWDD